MKGTDWAVLAAVGFVGYGLIRSDFFKGVGDIGTGVGDAVEGVGSGIGYAGQSAGYNLADIFNAFGQLGQSTQTIIKEGGSQLREVVYQAGTDAQVIVDKTGDIVVDASTAASDISGSLRNVNKGFWDSFNKTYNLNEPTNIFSNVAQGGAYVVGDIKNKVSSVFDWVKTQVSEDKSVRSSPSITGAVIGKLSTTSSSSGNNNRSVRTSSITSQSQQSNPSNFMEKIGYQGTSTINGVVWTPKPISLPW